VLNNPLFQVSLYSGGLESEMKSIMHSILIFLSSLGLIDSFRHHDLMSIVYLRRRTPVD